jgi:hypothetical protein
MLIATNYSIHAGTGEPLHLVLLANGRLLLQTSEEVRELSGWLEMQFVSASELIAIYFGRTVKH